MKKQNRVNVRLRVLTVSYYPSAKWVGKVPYIRLCGHWLRDSGFHVGEKVWLRILPGEIMLVRHSQKSSPRPK